MSNHMIPVNRRALIARIDRALRKQDRHLRADRRGRRVRYLLIDIKWQIVVETDVDLEKLARELAALEPWERLA